MDCRPYSERREQGRNMSLNMRFKRKPLRPVLAILSLAALLAVVAAGTWGGAVRANVLGYLAAPPAPDAVGKDAPLAKDAPAYNDGFDALPPGQKALSYSTLA